MPGMGQTRLKTRVMKVIEIASSRYGASSGFPSCPNYSDNGRPEPRETRGFFLSHMGERAAKKASGFAILMTILAVGCQGGRTIAAQPVLHVPMIPSTYPGKIPPSSHPTVTYL